MNEQLKTIMDVFPDFDSSLEIINFKIKSVNIHKKNNELTINLLGSKEINLDEMLKFENYLINRFSISKATISVEYEDNTKIRNIQESWNSITKYINKKYPLTKSILANSKIEEENKKITIILAVKGADFLAARGFNKVIEDFIYNIYRQKIKVECIEKIDEELVKKYEENARRAEKMAIELAEQEISWEEEKNNTEIKVNNK